VVSPSVIQSPSEKGPVVTTERPKGIRTNAATDSASATLRVPAVVPSVLNSPSELSKKSGPSVGVNSLGNRPRASPLTSRSKRALPGVPSLAHGSRPCSPSAIS